MFFLKFFMNNLSLQYYKSDRIVLVLILLTGILTYMSGLIKEFLTINNYDISIPSVVVIIGMILVALDKHLYRIPFLWNFLMKVPYIGGLYKGQINFTYTDPKINEDISKSKICEMRIRQTCSHIKICCKFYYEEENNDLREETKSESFSELLKVKNEDVKLYFAYRNFGISINSKIPSGLGFNILEYSQENHSFKGHYFSERPESKNGNINVSKIK